MRYLFKKKKKQAAGTEWDDPGEGPYMLQIQGCSGAATQACGNSDDAVMNPGS